MLQRQRLLRAAGYAVRVDGSWGPRSQHFWAAYSRGLRPSARVPVAGPPLPSPVSLLEKQAARSKGRSAPKLPPTTRSRVEAALTGAPLRGDGGAGIRAAVAQDDAVRLEVRQARAVAAQARRKRPEQMSLDEVSALTVDPLTGHFNPTHPGDVRRIQSWLRAHGHPKLGVDGVFGRTTFAALSSSYFAAREHEQRQMRARLVSTLYDSGVVRPGGQVYGLGKVAGPGELLRELQAGGFGAAVAWRRLTELARDRGLEYLTWKEAELRHFDKVLNPVELPGYLTHTSARATANDRYLRLLASPSLDDSQKAQLRVLYSSQGFKEARVRLHQLAKVEAALRAHDLAGQRKHHWWQGAIDYTVIKPAEFLKDTGAASRHAVAAATIGVGASYLHHNQLGHGGQHYNSPDDEARRVGEWWRKTHPLLADALDFVADPAWALGDVGILGRAGVAAALRFEKLGYAIARDGQFVRIAALRPLSKAGLAFAAPARAGRLTKAGYDLTLDTLGQTHTGLALRYAAARATRLKTEAVTVARLNVNASLRHGFGSVSLPDNLDSIPVYKQGGDFHARLDLARADVTAKIETHLKHLMSALDRSQISLFVTQDRRELSGVGAALLARVAEVFRVNEVQRLALERAQAAFEHAAEGQGDAAARQAYREVVTKAGAYIRGAHDAEMAAEILPRVQRNLDRFEYVIFGELQNGLERRALGREGSLFDERGRWLQRDSLAANELRRLGADAFSPEREFQLVNPNYGKSFTTYERNQLVDAEVEDEVGRLRSWAAREHAVGRGRKKATIDALVEDKTSKVEAAWVRSKDGWIDSRETRGVPDIYARQAAHLFGAAAKGADPLLAAGEVPADALKALSELSSAPADVLTGKVEAELQRLAWSLAGGHDRPMLPEFAGIADRYRPLGAEWKDVNELKDSVDGVLKVLEEGYKTALPQALKSEGAMFAAFAHAQSAPMRVAYYSIAGPMQTWVWLTLPFRPGWGIRNIIDNTAKVLVSGARDPRVYGGVGHPGEAFASVFENDLRAIRNVAEKIDGLFGTDVGARFNRLLDSIWEHDAETLGRIFRAHDVPVPESVIEGARFAPLHEFGQRVPLPFRSASDGPDSGLLGRFRDGVWELMASRPENYYKRVLYRTRYLKEIEAGATEEEAFAAAWKSVEDTLFDYSKVTLLEDNLKPLLPFVQFWRKNTRFWLSTAFHKPWLPFAVYRYETDFNDRLHADEPEWMRRYISSNQLGDGLGQIPGLSWLADQVLLPDLATDPLNLFSFAPLYRAFRSENTNLPADHQGLAFVSGFVDAMNDWGLSMNPLIRKPLELEGVLNYRAWQSIFPQTALVQVATMQWWHEQFPEGLNIEAWLEDQTGLSEHLTGKGAQQRIADNFDYYVQMEMAGQAQRGEPVSRAAAEQKIRAFFAVQTLLGYFTGVYARRMTPSDVALYKLGDALFKGGADYLSLSPSQQRAYQLFKRRKLDAVEFDRYIGLIPMIQAYYGQGTYRQKEQFKLEHPEVLPYVEPAWSGKGLVKGSYVKTAALVQNTGFVMRMLDLASELRLPQDVRELAEAALVTPELKKFWAKNDTPAELRDRHLKLLFFKYVSKLNDTFHAIPADDFDAKQGFLDQHPVLVHWWAQNNTNSDDYKTIINASNAALRDLFFEKIDAEGWDSAQAFLRRYPFIFEFTRASKKVDPMTGDWIGGGGSGGHGGRGGRGLSQHARDYLAAKASLDEFFALPQAQRGVWLRSGSPAARAVRSYFAKYAHFHGGRGRTMTQHARDFLRAKPYLDEFFQRANGPGGQDAAFLWLHSAKNKRAARIVEAYFRKYAHPNGHSQHAIDFGRVKKQLDVYFKLPSGKRRSAWLHSGSHDAELVLAYFKKWGTLGRFERVFRKQGLLASSRPELNLRLKFWRRYWQLSPDQRPLFISQHAADYGVFVYGPIGAEQLHEREQEYLRKALALGVGAKQAMEVYVRPLLDVFFALKNRADKQLFLHANPELAYYFDHFVKASTTGDPKLDKKVEAYFALPQHSDARSEYLREHHDVQVYFDKHSTPAERAMRALLEVYFSLGGPERKAFGLKHPEIQAYFDKRANERNAEQMIGETFAKADPRLAGFWARARLDITIPGQLVAESLYRHRAHPGAVSRRVDRSA